MAVILEMRGTVQVLISMAIAGMVRHGSARISRLDPGSLPLLETNQGKPLMASEWALVAITIQ